MTDQCSPCTHPTWQSGPPDFEEVWCSDCGLIIPGNSLTHAGVRFSAAVDEFKRVVAKVYIEPVLERLSMFLKRLR